MASLLSAVDVLQEIDNSLSPEELRSVGFICLLDECKRGLVGKFNSLNKRYSPGKALALVRYALGCISSDHSERLEGHCSVPAENWFLEDAKVAKIPLRACLVSINKEITEDQFDSLKDALVARGVLGSRCEYRNKDLRFEIMLDGSLS